MIGATGYVGSAVVNALVSRRYAPIPIRAPRLTECSLEAASLIVRDAALGCTALINCAGIGDPTCSDIVMLKAANSDLPRAAARAAAELEIRFIHVSTAAVQGGMPTLSETRDARPFSPYSVSKADGETAVLTEYRDAVIYRPPGVHHPSRRVTQSLARLARSPLSSVEGDGDMETPQALLEDVADAIAFLAVGDVQPPAIVVHPGSGVTAASLLTDLGDRQPKHLPRWLTTFILAVGDGVGRRIPKVSAQTRRVEILWRGQSCDGSWLDAAGWTPVCPKSRWPEIGIQLRAAARGINRNSTRPSQ